MGTSYTHWSRTENSVIRLHHSGRMLHHEWADGKVPPAVLRLLSKSGPGFSNHSHRVSRSGCGSEEPKRHNTLEKVVSSQRTGQNKSSPIVHVGSTRTSATPSLSVFRLDLYDRSEVHEWRTSSMGSQENENDALCLVHWFECFADQGAQTRTWASPAHGVSRSRRSH